LSSSLLPPPSPLTCRCFGLDSKSSLSRLTSTGGDFIILRLPTLDYHSLSRNTSPLKEAMCSDRSSLVCFSGPQKQSAAAFKPTTSCVRTVPITLCVCVCVVCV